MQARYILTAVCGFAVAVFLGVAVPRIKRYEAVAVTPAFALFLDTATGDVRVLPMPRPPDKGMERPARLP